MTPETKLLAFGALIVAFWALLWYTLQQTHKIPLRTQFAALERLVRPLVDRTYRKRLKRLRTYEKTLVVIAQLYILSHIARERGADTERLEKFIDTVRKASSIIGMLTDADIDFVVREGFPQWGKAECTPDAMRDFLRKERDAAPTMTYAEVLEHPIRLKRLIRGA